MKKLLNILLILIIFVATAVKAQALNFESAFKEVGNKPMVVLIYAQWADNYQNYVQQFRLSKLSFGNKFNFVELDLASKDAKAYCERYHIYPKLPYIIMYRDGGKVSRYIPRDCASSSACITSKLKSFVQ